MDEYNAEFTLAIEELQNLQHTNVPDATRQTKLYFDGLKPHVKGQMQHKLTEAHISNMTLLMRLASECEHLSLCMQNAEIHFGGQNASHNGGTQVYAQNRHDGGSSAPQGSRGGGQRGRGRGRGSGRGG